MFRNKKLYADDLAKLQRQDVIFARPESYSYVSTEKIELTAYVSRYSAAASKPMTIRCYFNNKLASETKVKAAERGSVVQDESIALTAPDVTKPTAMRVKLELRGANNTLVAENYLELFIYPEPKKRSGSIYLAPPLSQMADALRSAGYTLVSAPDNQSVIVTNKLDPQTQSLLKSGRRLIVLANDQGALPEGAIKVSPRNGGTGYDGNWVTNFNWVDVNRAPFSALAFDKILGFEAEAVSPKFVVEGVKGADYDDVLSGIFLGWVNKNAALMLGARSGQGRAVITTFRLAEMYGKDEYARHLFDETYRLVMNQEFNPRLALD
jgi:hypothetical protein